MKQRPMRLFVAVLAAALMLPQAIAGETVAVRAGRIYPVSDAHPWVIENGTMLLRDGKIIAVGADVAVPAGARVIELPDATIMPGLVLASNGLAGMHLGEESVAAGYRAEDAFDRYADFRTTLASGITTAHLSPGWHRLMSGQGAVVKLAGPSNARVLAADTDLTINLGPAIYNTPRIQELLVPPSPDRDVEPSRAQRPGSRVTRFLALREAIAEALNDDGGEADLHRDALRDAWLSRQTIRVQAQERADIIGAASFLASQERSGYIVGGQQAAELAGRLSDAGLPLVYTIDASFAAPGGDIGSAVDPLLPDLSDLAELRGLQLALGLPANARVTDFRLAAAMAQRGGLSERQALRAVTIEPASILGVDDRVGSLDAGKDADFIVLHGAPLETNAHIALVFVNGKLAYHAPESNAIVVKAGTIWLGPNNWLRDGSVLIEDGRIVDVGRRVQRPPHAQVINAGADAFVTPGFIDAFGHLGLRGDNGATPSDVNLARVIGAPDEPEHRVARAGVTTVMMAPYRFTGTGSRFTAVKTAGQARRDRVVRETAAMAFDVRNIDAALVAGRLKGRLDAGKKYLETWQKYEKELAEWLARKEAGELTETKPKVVEETAEEEAEVDPITGTWDATLTSEQIPEPANAKIALKLDGNKIEGQVVEPPSPIEHKIVGELNGTTLKGTIEIETGGAGVPEWEAEIDREDHIVGKISMGGFLEADIEMTRTDKGPVDLKVVTRRRRTQGEDGRPLPPKVDETLEPIKAILEHKIPAVVAVSTPKQIEAVLNLIVDEWELPLVLLDAQGARLHLERLREKGVGVIVPTQVVRRENDAWYNQSADLSRGGVAVAFQSNAGDGARTLPTVGLYAVEQGLSAEQALAALTIDAARMYLLDDRIGAIAPGCDGDLLIFSGHPFDADSAIQRVIINGQEVPR